MGILIPITEARVALAFNQWCTIHASLHNPWQVAEAQKDREHGFLVAVETVCGSHVYPYLVNTPDPARGMLMPWPPPADLRCVDCVTALGNPRLTPAGAWKNLRDVAS